jgi:hypothetical protein
MYGMDEVVDQATHAGETGVFGTQDELDLASGLLETHDESGLENFLARMLQRARAATRARLDSGAIQPLAALLKRTALKLGLPDLNRLRLAAVKSPRLAAQIPGVLARAGRLFGIELEGLSPEDQEFEIARRFVRLGGESLRQLAARNGVDSPDATASFARAARTHAPGLLKQPSGRAAGNCGCAGNADPFNHDTASRSLAMHDIDHTKAELDPEADSFELDELDELEFSDELDEGSFDESEYDSGEFDAGEYDSGEYDAGELDSSETGSPFSEVEESELANELLGLSSEQEMDQFLGKVFKRAWRGAQGLSRSLGGIARPLSGMLKGVAKKMLPMAAGAAGTFFGGPAGGALGSKLGSLVGNALESELSGMSAEDRDFEVAKTFVRVAGDAAKQAVQAPAQANPVIAAKNAVVRASRRAVPRFGRRRRPSNYQGQGHGRRRTGRWVRRGNRIILFGV